MQFLKKLNMNLLCELAISLLEIAKFLGFKKIHS